VERSIVAITLGVWLGQSGIVVRSKDTLAARLKVNHTTKVLLLLFAQDDVLERTYWPRRREFIHSLKVLRPDAVVAPDFSTWDRDPRLEQRYAIVRSVRVFGLLQEHGIPAIPHVYWGTLADQDDWIRWLNANDVRDIAIDMQCKRRITAPYLGQLSRLYAALDRPPHLLVNGVAHRASLAAILRVWPDASFTSNLVPQASAGRLSMERPDGSTVRRSQPKLGRPAIHRMEVESLERLIRAFKSSAPS
jgi:hypothetical protein